MSNSVNFSLFDFVYALKLSLDIFFGNSLYEFFEGKIIFFCYFKWTLYLPAH